MMQMILICLFLGTLSIVKAGISESKSPFQDKKNAISFLRIRVKRGSLHEECSDEESCSYEEAREDNYGHEEICEYFKRRKCTEMRCGLGYTCETRNDNGCLTLNDYQVHCQVIRKQTLRTSTLEPRSSDIPTMPSTVDTSPSGLNPQGLDSTVRNSEHSTTGVFVKSVPTRSSNERNQTIWRSTFNPRIPDNNLSLPTTTPKFKVQGANSTTSNVTQSTTGAVKARVQGSNSTPPNGLQPTAAAYFESKPSSLSDNQGVVIAVPLVIASLILIVVTISIACYLRNRSKVKYRGIQNICGVQYSNGSGNGALSSGNTPDQQHLVVNDGYDSWSKQTC